jgi:Regulator of chromosome condensation (RCC1) repeat
VAEREPKADRMSQWQWFVLAALVVTVLVGASWKVWNDCWFGLLCDDGLVAFDRQIKESRAKDEANEHAWRAQHPDKKFLNGYTTASALAHLPTVRGLYGHSFLLENGRLLSPKEALGLRMGLNADLQGPALAVTAVALVASPRQGYQQDILWSDGRLTRNQRFDARTGTASPSRWTEDRPDSVQIDDGVALVRGGNFRLVLRRDGTVWGYGVNDFGQLGTLEENLNNQLLPLTRPVAGLTGVTAIAAGKRHALALKSDGTVWQWGANNSFVKSLRVDDEDGNHGRGPRRWGFNPEPTRVPGLPDIVKIAAGQRHNLALDKNGVVWGWGDSELGLLGIPARFSDAAIGMEGNFKHIKGSFVDEPVHLPGMDQVVDIAAAGYHTIALKRDGTVWGWGMNSSRQLGVREDIERAPSLDADPMRTGPRPDRPFQMFGVRDIRRIFTSASFSALIDKNGDLFRMGGPDPYDFAACVPGRAGRKTRIQFSLEIYDPNLITVGTQPPLNSEVGLYALDDTLGRVGGLLPGDVGYASAALAPGRAVPVFEPGRSYGSVGRFRGLPGMSLKLDAGRFYGFYLIADSDRLAWQRENPKNTNEEKIKAFFSFPAANPDRLEYGYFYRDLAKYPYYYWKRRPAIVDPSTKEDTIAHRLFAPGLANAGIKGCTTDYWPWLP